MNPARCRAAVAAAFATQGLVFISLTTRLPDLRDRWDLSEIEVSLILLAIVLLAGVGSLLTEKLAARMDSARLLRVGLVAIGVGFPLVVASPQLAGFALGIAVYGLGLGIMDATTNMQAVAVEHLYRRPILPSFHGAWTLGGLIGSGLTLALAEAPFAVSAAICAVPLLALALPYLPAAELAATDRVPTGADQAPAPLPLAIAWRPILLVGAGMVIFYMVDTASQTWGAIYLDEVFAAPSRWVALATLPYLLASLIVRLAGDSLVHRYGAAPVLRAGAVVACAGLALVTLAPTWPWAVVGFTVVGLGISVVAPMSFSAAAAIAAETEDHDGAAPDPAAHRRRVDAVIARFNQFNYVGALLGAVLTGLVGAQDLRFGFCIPMVLVLALLPLARWFRGPDTTPAGSTPAGSTPAGSTPAGSTPAGSASGASPGTIAATGASDHHDPA